MSGDDVRAVVPLDRPLDAVVSVPGSKSITNRALVCAALADGRSALTGALSSDDTDAMTDCLRRLGVAVSGEPADRLVVDGLGRRPLPAGPVTLDARLSGTTSRFVLPVLSLGPGPYVLDGGEPLRARPMADGLAALAPLGSRFVELGEPGHLPVRVEADPDTGPGAGGEVRLRADVSSQFASGLLLVAPMRPDGLRIRLDGEVVSRPYLELTAAVMESFGAEVDRSGGRSWTVAPTGYRARTYAVEPDASAASYFFAAPVIAGGRVRVIGLGRDALQGDVAFVDALARMGAEVTVTAEGIEVASTGVLHGIEADFADLSDTAQTLAVVAAFADSPTTITGIGFIRRKETDRIAATVTELRRCGIGATELDDGIRIEPGPAAPATVRTYDDHRMAMSFALLGLGRPGIEIADPGCVGKTFPGYWDVLDSLGHGGNVGDAAGRS